MFVFWNPCARAKLHQQERALKLCSATLSLYTYLSTGWGTSSENESTKGESKSSLLPYVTDGGNLLSFFLLTWALAYDQIKINRGYYMVARTYEFYVRAARTISHSWDIAVMIQVWVHSEQQQSSLFSLFCLVFFFTFVGK